MHRSSARSRISASPVIGPPGDLDDVEQRLRKTMPGLVFEPAAPEPMGIAGMSRMDMLLVFQAPPPASGPWKLELPASTWDRNGACRLLVPRPFPSATNVP